MGKNIIQQSSNLKVENSPHISLVASYSTALDKENEVKRCLSLCTFISRIFSKVEFLP